ncbi:UDP-N-acetylglucosamine--LPS N-acetylglucosamine transferase [Hwanghaeella grinnelliae]|uniref:UDP-N-acetylglucosamine--LPS N-acetylglucosamine transferase n=1 Tax=Hwanghaeella grinnelliae TaxID=2500179 RepID=A0A3S2VMP1_9PROT|nr:UDP-N-acetylglucosamine--LPS N-acetylglucosamine transferase [Hwanghaeella grinnelliae]RVU34117.1 UDP-N-acetylglucosamine--LPS N-acetylglucosamine transferase [Hwanghaeella grinnelliae]
MTKKILAVASGGGHWQQLMLMRRAFEGNDVRFITTLPGLPEQFDAHPAAIVRDCNRNERVKSFLSLLAITWQILKFRPDVIISTGALPGVMALAVGRLFGARTIWVDSIANAEEMSMSGRLARRFAHLWLSQWDHVAKDAGAEYAGAVL